jgi:hypothetical protein
MNANYELPANFNLDAYLIEFNANLASYYERFDAVSRSFEDVEIEALIKDAPADFVYKESDLFELLA